MGAGALGWARGRVAGAGRAWAREQALQAAGRAGTRRSGRVELAGARQAERAAGWASGNRRARRGSKRSGHGSRRAGERGRRRHGRAGRLAGRPGRGLGVQLGQVGCFGAPDSVFDLV